METYCLAVARHQHHVFVALGNGHVHQVLTFLQFHGDQAGAARTGKVGQLGTLDHTAGGGHEDERTGHGIGHDGVVITLCGIIDHVFRVDGGVFVFFAVGFLLTHHVGIQTQNGGNSFFCTQRWQQVHNWLAAGGPATLRQLEGA